MVRQLYTASTGGSKESMQVGQNHREINLVTQQNKKFFFFSFPLKSTVFINARSFRSHMRMAKIINIFSLSSTNTARFYFFNLLSL